MITSRLDYSSTDLFHTTPTKNEDNNGRRTFTSRDDFDTLSTVCGVSAFTVDTL